MVFLLKNPILAWILLWLHACNLTVHRRLRTVRSCCEVSLRRHQTLSLFPEGTNYAKTRIMQVQSGAARADLKHTEESKENGSRNRATIVSVATIYTNKSKCRSQAIVDQDC
ncbi:hypothetical protein BC835DRAFT_499004 [Cytidiella melzeri]|nr:hypothetical protein BC835DRAFT_499004 [Cytidiella melzeri]